MRLLIPHTIIQSLIHAIPLLVFPGPIFERRFKARKVQEAGAGRLGELTDFKAEWIQPVLAKRYEFAANAQLLGRKIESLGGASHAVQAIQAAFAKGIGRDQVTCGIKMQMTNYDDGRDEPTGMS